jgi:hypothetical protein
MKFGAIIQKRRIWYIAIGMVVGFLIISNLTTVEVQRTACLGICPVYTLRVWGNGLVTYHGEFGLVTGDRISFISPFAAWQLFGAALGYGLTYFDPVYTNGNTDYEGSRTCLGLGTLTKCVRVTSDYSPTLAGQPTGLRELNRLIDEVTNSVQWTGTIEQRLDMYVHSNP